MNSRTISNISINEIKIEYCNFLKNHSYSDNYIKTACNDSFYLWKNASPNVFWNTVTSENFEIKGRQMLIETLKLKSTGNPYKLVNNYMHYLRKFKEFIESQESKTTIPISILPNNKSLSKESTLTYSKLNPKNIDFYVEKWKDLENYRLQEEALKKLFLKMCPQNKSISDILLKVSTLNDFYSTKIFSVYSVSKHILDLSIDKRLNEGDETLVNEIKRVVINDKIFNFYSFATKYCSHHNPKAYPIYDSYVKKALCYFRNQDKFSSFTNSDLKNYNKFKKIIIDFKKYYGLDEYSFEMIDKYLWQIGKELSFKNN